jgi:hypothetical protein
LFEREASIMLTTPELMGQPSDFVPVGGDVTMDASSASKNNDCGFLQGSEVTTSPPTETGSSVDGEEEDGGWFGTIGSDFKVLATSIKDTLPPVIGGFANFVHRSAMTVAAEIAELERQGEIEAERWRQENYGNINENSLRLPWEIKATGEEGGAQPSSDDQLYADEELLDIILGLSLQESTFQEPFAKESEDKSGRVMDELRLDLIRRLLAIDQNLAAHHENMKGT